MLRVNRWLLLRMHSKSQGEETDESVPKLRYACNLFYVELGLRIRQLRKESGLTIRALFVQHGSIQPRNCIEACNFKSVFCISCFPEGCGVRDLFPSLQLPLAVHN